MQSASRDFAITHPSESSTQAELAFNLIRADILSCRTKPGTKLKINDLCTRHGLNLGAVREALSRLSAAGFVIAEPQKGYSVAPVSRDDLIDLTRARIDIEGLCLADAIEHGDVRWESEILASYHRLRHLPERNPADVMRLNEEWAIAHAEFHSVLVAACSSRWLLRMRAMLFAQSERYRRLSFPMQRKKRDTNAEHNEIAQAAIAGDAPRAVALLGAHLQRTTDVLLQYLDAEGIRPTRTPKTP